MPSPRLSVVIPHLNEPEDLRRCLASLAGTQVNGDFEIIVVDNGSAELPVEICSAVEGVRLVSELTPGPGPARNRGVAYAQAELVAFIDADCMADPGWVAAMLDHMDNHPGTDFAGGDIRILPLDPSDMTAVESYECIFSYSNEDYVRNMGFSATGNMVVRKTVFQAVGPFAGIDRMEDTEWGQRATAMGYCIAYIAGARVYTPSCRSFEELKRRWSRHVAHDYQQSPRNARGVAGWLGRSALVALSPIVGIPRIVRSDRVSAPRERWDAFTCLARIRFHRAVSMLRLLLHDNAAATVGAWNREGMVGSGKE